MPSTVTLESIHDSVVLTVVVRDAEGGVLSGFTPSWSVDSAHVATVADGIVVARSRGSASVTASVWRSPAALSSTVPVVVAPRTRSRTLVPQFDTIGVGGKLGMRLTSYDARGTPIAATSPIGWSTSDPAVATIDASGMLTGHSLGEVLVTGTTADGPMVSRVVVRPRSGVRVSAGPLNSCALSPTGEAYCWGFNDQGQLGSRSSPHRCTAGPILGSYPCSLIPQKVAGGLSFRMIANGFEHACALDAEGAAYCWGANDLGQLGSGDAAEMCEAVVFGTRGPCSFTPIAVATPARFVTIGVGYRTTCGLTTDGLVLCWGDNDQGSIGAGTWNESYPRPTEVAGGLRYRSLSVGRLHACAVATDGRTHCWGYNASGALGEGTWQPRLAPTPVSGGHTFDVVSAGWEHTCAFGRGQGAYCWGQAVGFTPSGRFGPNWESAPLPTRDRTPVDTLVSGTKFSCGLYDAWARCWGANHNWELGGPLADEEHSSTMPADVQLPATFESIAAGSSHVCGVRTGGAVYCWGKGIEGQLGDGKAYRWELNTYRSRPVRVTLPFR